MSDLLYNNYSVDNINLHLLNYLLNGQLNHDPIKGYKCVICGEYFKQKKRKPKNNLVCDNCFETVYKDAIKKRLKNFAFKEKEFDYSKLKCKEVNGFVCIPFKQIGEVYCE